MQNPELWKQERFLKDARGRFTGPYMERIIGRAYEPLIRAHATGRLVDLGCGKVPYYGWYRDQVKETVCVDWAHTVRGTTHLDHFADLNEPLPVLESASFNTVLCTHEAPHDHHRYTEHKLRHWCAKHDLEVLELHTYGGWPEVVFDQVYKGIDYLDLPLKRIWLGAWKGLGKLLAKVGAVKRMSMRSRSTFPLGYVLVARVK